MRLLALVISLVFALTACNGGGEVESAPEPTVSIESLYLEVVREEEPDLIAVPDSNLVGLADNICEFFASGGSFEDAVYLGVESGMDIRTTAFLVGASTAAFCPEYKYKFSSEY